MPKNSLIWRGLLARRLSAMAGLVVRQSPFAALAGAGNVAGGWRYHLYAWRYRHTLWAPYTEQVSAFLNTWQPRRAQLVIIGPSAGWHLPAAFLQRFEQVVAIEPDPLARWLLRRRFPQVRWVMHSDDYFTPDHPAGWSANTARLFADYPNAALLFANFLGQLIGLYPGAVAEEQGDDIVQTRVFGHWKAQFAAQLATRTFASLHDCWSSAQPPLQALPQNTADLSATAAPFGHSAQVVDHLIGGLLPQLPRKWLTWQRKPQMWHVIEALAQDRS